MNTKTLLILCLSCIFIFPYAIAKNHNDRMNQMGTKLDFPIKIPPGGNSWVINNIAQNQKIISEKGIQNWKDPKSIIRTYFKTNSTGKIYVGLNIKAATGKSNIKVTIGGKTKELVVANPNFKDLEVGVFELATAGYHYIEIQGLEKSGDVFGDIAQFLIGGPAVTGEITYVKDDFYFGRRGPSVHLNYNVPDNTKVKLFYNEITVPEGEDVLGSYFMANGFGEGYFGIQVNSETERRILFSVWSPFKTQNPKEIPEDFKIVLLGKGQGVTTGEFGNEGSGGQSYKVFDWKAGKTYKFLLKGEPSTNGSTDYTAYFYAPEIEEWMLIASFRRPHTETHLTHLYSFLENFTTETGFKSRKTYYSNQWIFDTMGKWQELTTAKFTADATARKGSREDYEGGSKGNTFYLKNCGFFSETTTIGTELSRTANGVAPIIDFSKLGIPTIPN